MVELLTGDERPDESQVDVARLEAWSRAFEAWLAEQQASSRDMCLNARRAWGRLLGGLHRPPWALTGAEIEQHLDGLRRAGYATSTTGLERHYLSRFYDWCDERRVDPACPPGFNPAKAARPLADTHWRGPNGEPVRLLTRIEVENLLGVLRLDDHPLGRRNHAFFLARLRLGVRTIRLQRLEWRQIEAGPEGGRVRWRVEEPQGRLAAFPQEVWEAILAYLRESGRLEGMARKSPNYVFAPLRPPLFTGKGGEAQDWEEERAMTRVEWLYNLRRYGLTVGIPGEKLTLQTLRRTAVRMWMEAQEATGGADDRARYKREMSQFLDCTNNRNTKWHRFQRLPEMAEGEGERLSEERLRKRIPKHEVKAYTPEDSYEHGLYAKEPPPEEVEAVLAEGQKGLEEEIRCQRNLEARLLDFMEEPTTGPAGSAAHETQKERLYRALHLLQLLTKTSYRVMEMYVIRNEIERGAAEERQLRAELDGFIQKVAEEGWIEIQPGPAEAKQTRSEAVESRLQWEAAAVRVSLRKLYRLAMAASDHHEFATKVYGYQRGCRRLVKILRAQEDNRVSLQEKMEAAIQQALEEVRKELLTVEG